MANDFTQDPNCVALWRFEDGQVNNDSIGNNTLVQTLVADTVNYKEGGASLDNNGVRWGLITDDNLDAGFPFKSGGGVHTMSVCYWCYITSPIGPTTYAVIEKGSTNPGRSFICGFRDMAARLILSTDGSNFLIFQHSGTLQLNRWYHIGMVADDNFYRVRVTTEAGAEVAPDIFGDSGIPQVPDGTNHLHVSWYQDNVLSGNTDEIVVFSRVLSVAEIDSIREQTFPAAEKAFVGNRLTASRLRGRPRHHRI